MLRLLVFLVACRGESLPPAEPWSGQDERVPLEHEGFAELNLGELALYSQSVAGTSRPDVPRRGTYGVGNGRAFALMGLVDPLNTLHSAVGPTYQRGDRFFGDLSMGLEVAGERLPFEREWISQVRGAPVTVTRGDVGGASLYTVDLAPVLASGETPAVLVRWLLVDPGVGAEPPRVCLDSYTEPVLTQGVPMWTQFGGRSLALGGDWVEGEGGWCLSQDAPAVPIVLAFGASPEEALAGLESDGEVLRAWTAQTLDHWAAFRAEGVQIASPDERISDLYQMLRTSVRVQQTRAGGISPMSRYTGVWLRDTIGPVRFFSRAGLRNEAREMLDYLHLCHVSAGDYGNACSSGLEYGDALAEPSWGELGEFGGRLAAEGPSYVPLSWTTWARWSGDWSPVAAHWDYLARGLLAQQMDAEGRQTWSGDETFRLAMNVAFGTDLEAPWPELAWSSNSSLLMAAAADAMVAAAEQVGEDAAPFAERAALARHALDTHFLQPDGHLAAVLPYDGTAETRPYEDAMLKMLWVPAYSPDDPAALRAIESLRGFAQPEPGVFQSPMDPRYQALPLLGEATEGYATGMTPGYSLFALTELGAVDSEDAFNWLPYYADPGGQYSEGVLWDDGSAVQLGYDAGGLLGDFAARYRPWEGAIVGDALLAFLIGAEPTTAGLRLRPHLPNNLPWMDYQQIAVRDQVVDLRLEQDRRGVVAVLRARTSATVTLELPVPRWMSEDALRHDGEERVLPGGERLVVFPEVALAEGEERRFELRR